MNSRYLYNAAENGDWDTMRALLQSNNVQDLVEYTDDSKRNILHQVCSRFEDTPLDITQAMINTSGTAPLQQDVYGHTPLHEAIRRSTEEIIIALLVACPRAAFVTNNLGRTPLHEATDNNHSSYIIHRLLAVNPTAAIATDNDRNTPLHIFFRFWNVSLRNQLESIRGDVKPIDNVILRCEIGKEKLIGELHEIALLLVQAATNGGFEENQKSLFQPLHLHVAIIIPHCPWSFTNFILRMDPEQASKWDQEGNLPIHIAAAAKSSLDRDLYECLWCYGRIQTLSWYQSEYLDYCQNCCHFSEEEKKTFNFIDSVDKIPAVIRDLLATNSKYAQIPNCQGKLPLQIAIEHGKIFKKLKTIFQAAPEALSTRGIKTHLYPFMLSAIQYSEKTKRKKGKPTEEFLQKFTSCYSFLMENPVLVKSGIPVKGCKRSPVGDEKSK